MGALPDVPTLQEQGLAGYEVTGWWATYFPAKTPMEVVAKMRDIMQEAVKTQSVKDAFTNFGLEPMPVMGSELAAVQRQDFERWGKLVRKANLSGQ